MPSDALLSRLPLLRLHLAIISKHASTLRKTCSCFDDLRAKKTGLPYSKLVLSAQTMFRRAAPLHPDAASYELAARYRRHLSAGQAQRRLAGGRLARARTGPLLHS